MNRRLLLLLAGVIIVLAGIGAAALALTRSNDGLSATFESPNTFRVRYPAEWGTLIPYQGVWVAGPLATINEGAPGPTFTVQRLNVLAAYNDSLAEALDTYLRRGPLAPGKEWALEGSIATSTFAGRTSLVAHLSGRENAASPPSRARVTAAMAANGFVYLLVATAPQDQWTGLEARFAALEAAVTLLE
jgi:hypothetical protein